MDLISLEIIIIVGVVLHITSGLPYGERQSWGSLAGRTSLGGVLFPIRDELASFETRSSALRDDSLPDYANIVVNDSKRMRRRKMRLPRRHRKGRRENMLFGHERLSEETKYPLYISEKDLPKVLNILNYIAKEDDYKKSRRIKRGRVSARQGLIGNSDSMDRIDGGLYPQSSSGLSAFEQLSLELSRLRCQQLQSQRDAMRVLEMADPSNFQHRSDHLDPPC